MKITKQEFDKKNYEENFKNIFNHKGIVGPFAEKSYRNYNAIFNPTEKDKLTLTERVINQRLHYFAIGHTYKQFDTENVFKYELDEKQKRKMPTRFVSLQSYSFDIAQNLEIGLEHIRNLNSHFIHNFDFLKKISLQDFNTQSKKHFLTPEVVTFLSESFELATLNIFSELEKDDLNDVLNSFEKYEQKYVTFLSNRFYPLNNKYKDEEWYKERSKIKEYFINLKKEEAIRSLLFVNLENDTVWKLGEYECFDIPKGEYLSHIGCLFLTTMFLYKHEAEQLVGNIKTFKRTEDAEYRSKRKIFLFFAKKLSSEDIPSEEKKMIFFRDIIMYLNNYPVAWNGEIEKTDSEQLPMTHDLQTHLQKMEIERCFGELAKKDDFARFALDYLFNGKIQNIPNQKLYLDLIDKNPDLKYLYLKIIENNVEIETFKVNNFNTFLLKYLLKNYFPENPHLSDKNLYVNKEKLSEFEKKLIENKTITKLKERIKHNLLYEQYGRNQDRFMEFAARFLAESHYFGNDAKFKMYRYYTTDEQNEALENLKNELTPKKFDKLKYHQGKLVHFQTYDEHLKKYPAWDTPFVVENNAVQVELFFTDGKNILVSIQRNLMIYMLEHAFQQTDLTNAGKYWLKKYCDKHAVDFEQSRPDVQTEDISSLQRKLYPKRLLKYYRNNPHTPSVEIFKKWKDEAESHEKRYNMLLEKARNENNEENFLKRNKGKQFKLRFVRKVWNLLYFSEIYAQKRPDQNAPHHKSYNITKEEYNDFCRYMFAFDEVPRYKFYLRELLDNKDFFKSDEFRILFEQSASLDDMYVRTKTNFEKWLQRPELKIANKEKYTPAGYENILNKNVFYINISHFISSVNWEKTGNKLRYKTAESNSDYLNNAFYYRETLPKELYKDKSACKLYNRLRTNRLEDLLLYEIALHYRYPNVHLKPEWKQPVNTLLTADVEIDINDNGNQKVYTLIVPFKKIDTYFGIQKIAKEKMKHGNFMTGIIDYMNRISKDKEIEKIKENYTKENCLTFENFQKLEKHLLTHTLKFTPILMQMEEYFIRTQNIKIKGGKNRILYEHIQGIDQMIPATQRNAAQHFNVPAITYIEILKKLERNFIQKYVHPKTIKDYDELPKPEKRICDKFLETLHNHFFDRTIKDKQEKRQKAKDTYLKEIILK